MKNKTSKIILSLSIVLIFFGFIFGFWIQRSQKNNLASEMVMRESSLVEIQSNVTSRIHEDLSKDMNIYLDPYDIAPLSALVTFTTDEEVAVTVTVKGQKGSPDLTHTFETSFEHILPIYGLYADSANEVIISYDKESIPLTIQTDALPDDFTVPTSTYINDEYAHMLNDFYFVTPASVGYTSAFDAQGNVRWYLTEQLVWEIRTLNNGNLILSNEKLINPPYYTTGMYELDLLGNIKKEYIMPGGYHHDVAELPNGNLLVASNDFATGTVEDVYVEIDRVTGDVIKYVNLRDILEVEGGRSENWIDFDWFHNNSIWYDEQTNSVTLSGRHQDLVVNLDYDTNEINYLLGDDNNYSESYQQYFLKPEGDVEWQYAQHAAKIMPNGQMILFDNGINRSKYEEEYISANDNYSRGVVYDIDQEAMTVKQVYEYGKERGSNYFSSYISDVDYLNENHYLIHSGGVAFNNDEVLNQPPGLSEYTALRSYTSEILNDELIFELQLPNNYYRAEKINMYDHATMHELQYGETIGTLGMTEIDKEYISLFPGVKEDADFLKSIDLDISHDGERLIVSGNFSKEDDVNILLYSKFMMKQYRVRISERPYTAMCIVVFDDQQQAVTKYINDYDLQGEYVILIEVNGTTYATGKRIAY